MFTFYSWRQIASVIGLRLSLSLSLCAFPEFPGQNWIPSWIYSGSVRNPCIIHHFIFRVFTSLHNVSDRAGRIYTRCPSCTLQAESLSQQGQHLHVDSAEQVSGDVGPGIEEELGVRAQHLHRARVGDTG